jgi:DNA-binding transcriptional LysR family regulator
MLMTLPAGLDPDLLRAFSYVAEEGSFTRAAERVGRTQSAVSMQMQRLETLLGQRVLTRGKGEAVSLTPHGHYLLERTRDLLALNDEIWTTFRAPPMQGTVRLGTPDDYALRFLPNVLKRFADTHPSVEVDVTCASSRPLVGMLKAGELDLTLCSEGHEPGHWPTAWPADLLWRGPLMWISSERHAPHRLDPLPLALAGGECMWRNAAIRALERAGRRYRVAYTSETQAGTLTPVLAGLAVTVSPVTVMPAGLRALPAGEPLPELPEVGILLLQAGDRQLPATQALASHIRETFRAELKRP